MNNLLLVIAKAMPKEFIIEKLEDSLNRTKLAITEEEKKKAYEELSITCQLYMVHHMTETKTLEETMDLAKEANDVLKIHKRMHTES